MASFNRIIIVGYLGRDAEVRYTPGGTPVCDFSIATTERRKDRSGESSDITTWFRVALWGARGESLSQYLTKGKQVFVDGRLRQEEYTDRDGNRRTNLQVDASDVQFVGARGEDGPPSAVSSSRPQSAEPGPPPGPADDDIPF
jgi:single-strand DNA-binding protein